VSEHLAVLYQYTITQWWTCCHARIHRLHRRSNWIATLDCLNCSSLNNRSSNSVQRLIGLSPEKTTCQVKYAYSRNVGTKYVKKYENVLQSTRLR